MRKQENLITRSLNSIDLYFYVVSGSSMRIIEEKTSSLVYTVAKRRVCHDTLFFFIIEFKKFQISSYFNKIQ